MPYIEVFATGDEIGTYSSVSVSGASNGTKVTLNDVQTLGSVTDIYRIVIRDVAPGESLFGPVQTIDIYAYPDTVPASPPIYSGLIPDPDAYYGRATSAEIIFFGSPDNIVLNTAGLTDGTVQFGPGNNPPLSEELAIDAFPEDPPVFPCFAAGTLIETDSGPQAIETLRAGDLVRTLDNGLQPLVWVGQRQVAGRGDMAPIRIKAGALGNYRDLLVSPQHRMLINDWCSEVLVAAKHLVNGNTIKPDPMPSVTYVHLLFDRHEVIFAEGIASESLHIGVMALAAMGDQTHAEVMGLFPDLDIRSTHSRTARPCLRSWEGSLVA